jgi:ankyrin repeat protein
LRNCYDPPSLRSALEDLPDTLDETYARILESIPRNNKKDATTILGLLTWSERSLRLEEIADAVAVRPHVRPSFNPDNRMPEPRDLLRICSSLVVLVQRTHRRVAEFISADRCKIYDEMVEVTELQLAHFSVKEYLISDRITPSFADRLVGYTTRASIATMCLAYLSDLDHSLSLDELRAQFAFSQYCAMYWTDHAKAAGGADDELQARIMELMIGEGDSYATCYNLYDPDQPWINKQMERTHKPASLYYTSLTGLIAGVEALVDRGADINAQGGRYGNVLQAASAGGHDKIIQLLLDREADVDAQNELFGTALQVASAGGYQEIVQMLLARGADIDACGGHYGNALQAASAEGHDKIVQMLLDRGADVDAQNGLFGTALQAASAGGYHKIVRMLLNRGADVNAQGGFLRTALRAASAGGHDKTIRMLLERGARINTQGGRYCCTLHAALAEGHVKIVQMLLGRDAVATAKAVRTAKRSEELQQEAMRS